MLDWSPIFILSRGFIGYVVLKIWRHASRLACELPTKVKVESRGKHGGRTATVWRNSRASKRDVRSSDYGNYGKISIRSIDEFQINEINVDLRTSGFDNEVLSVDACAVWWERESFYCLPRMVMWLDTESLGLNAEVRGLGQFEIRLYLIVILSLNQDIH